jgi:hypothetical protein
MAPAAEVCEDDCPAQPKYLERRTIADIRTREEDDKQTGLALIVERVPLSRVFSKRFTFSAVPDRT